MINFYLEPRLPIENALRNIREINRIIHRYRYEIETPMSEKELQMMDELVELTKNALRDMFYANVELRARPPAPTTPQ